MSTFLMRTLLRRLALGLVLPLCCIPWSFPVAWGADRKLSRSTEKKAGTRQPGEEKAGDVLLATMQRELLRATTDLGHLDPAPYFVSYSVYEQEGTVVVGGLGILLN